MLVVETIARIRRDYFVKGKPIKKIVRDVKVSRNTVRKVIHGVDAEGAPVVRRQLRRSQLLKFFGALEPCLGGLKAVIVAAVLDAEYSDFWRFINGAQCRQHFLYFFPDPQGHGSFRPTFRYGLVMVFVTWIGCRLACLTSFFFCR